MLGTKVTLTLGGQNVVTYNYNGLLNDGAVGLLAKGGSSLFDSMTIWGDDQNFRILGETAGDNLTSMLADLYNNPTFTVTWLVDEEEE
jgi:hypothetical protein